MPTEKQQSVESETEPSDAEQEMSSLASGEEVGLIREFFDFLKCNKKWWLSPILIVLGVLMLFVVLSLTPAAPFIYTLF